MNNLSWNDLAELYDRRVGGRPARTLPMDSIFEWAKNQADIELDAEEGTLHFKPGLPPQIEGENE